MTFQYVQLPSPVNIHHSEIRHIWFWYVNKPKTRFLINTPISQFCILDQWDGHTPRNRPCRLGTQAAAGGQEKSPHIFCWKQIRRIHVWLITGLVNRKLKRVARGKECFLDIHTVLFFLILIFDYRVDVSSTNAGFNVNLPNMSS